MATPASTTYRVPNVSCDHCKHAIEGEVRAVAGVVDVQVDLAARTVRVESAGDEAEVRAAIERAGYAIASQGP